MTSDRPGPRVPARLSTNKWIVGARPRTLPAAVVPVVVGSALAIHEGGFIWWRASLCLVIGLAMQVGVNYANDYSDGVRGTDVDRVGPTRLVASGMAAPAAVKRAAFAAFGIGAAAGLILCSIVQPALIVVGIACVGAGWFYTGGPRPYGYSGLGELAVFVFFGLVATIGTAYLQAERVTFVMVIAACAVGSLAVALLVVNNLRDISGDTVAGKRTLAVRAGDSVTRSFYVVAIVLPFLAAFALIPVRHWSALVAVSWPLAVVAVRPVTRGASGRDLVAVLGATGRLQLAFGALFAIGLAV